MYGALVVDDDFDARKSASELLAEEGGFYVKRARSPREAVRKQRKDPMDVVLMDMKMPTADGLATAAAIREFDTNVQFIGVSAWGEDFMPRDTDQRIASWIHKPLIKPDTRASLIRKAEEAATTGGFPSRYFTSRCLKVEQAGSLAEVFRSASANVLGTDGIDDQMSVGSVSIDDIRDIFEAQIVSYFATIGRRAFLLNSPTNENKDSSVMLGREGRFLDNHARQILDRLPIDVYDAPKLLSVLYEDIAVYSNNRAIEGDWGRVVFDGSCVWIGPGDVEGGN